MEELKFGLILTLVGMGGTFLSLWIITLWAGLLKWLFPYVEETRAGDVKDTKGETERGSPESKEEDTLIPVATSLALLTGDSLLKAPLEASAWRMGGRVEQLNTRKIIKK